MRWLLLSTFADTVNQNWNRLFYKTNSPKEYMKVTTEKPPCFEAADKLFKLEELKIAAVFTYGSTIYNPSNVPLTPELIRHEETHMQQQEGSDDVAATWWKRFIQDVDFRIEQEAEAYAAQYTLYCQQVKDRNKRALYLKEIGTMLASPMYGNVIGWLDATQKIRHYAEGFTSAD